MLHVTGDLMENMTEAMRLHAMLEASFCAWRLPSNCQLPLLRSTAIGVRSPLRVARKKPSRMAELFSW